MTSATKSIHFSRAYWVANFVELLERMAFYGVFIVLTIYLSKIFAFSDIEAGIISGLFSGLIYLLSPFTGAIADRIGYRKAMMLAFGLLSAGYAGLGLLPEIMQQTGVVEYANETIYHGLDQSMIRWFIAPVLALIVIGGSFIKGVITGSVARETTTETRAKGFSIFYMMVNMGAFTGKLFPDPMRQAFGDRGLIFMQYLSAGIAALAFVFVYFLYKSDHTQGEGRSVKEMGQAILKVCCNLKLVVLILIISGFWLVQGQMYATMPKYVLRMIGQTATPGWYANVNPLVVVLMVNVTTFLMARRSALTSMTIGMFLMPLSACAMAMGNLVGSESILGLHPIAFMLICGIAIQAIAETFISPRFLEYFSLYAPKGDEALYLGFSQIHSFISYIVGFFISGVLLNKYCPDPQLFDNHEAWQAASANAHNIWFFFAGIGLIAAISLLIFSRVTKKS